MKKIILVSNDAPQSGKTTFARVLEQAYERKGIEVTSIYTAAAAAPDETAFWDLEEDPEPTPILAALAESDAVIVAVASGLAPAFVELFNDYGLFDSILEFDADLCLAIPANDTDLASQSAAALGEAFADNADYMLLSMPFVPEDETTATWSGSYGEKVMDYLGATVIEVPEFDAEMSSELAENGLDLATALTRRKELPRYLRDAVHSWELSFAEAIGDCEDQWVPESTGVKSVYESSAISY